MYSVSRKGEHFRGLAQKNLFAAMTSLMRRIAKTIAVQSGGLSLYHRLKHREHLTVLMFHRVLPTDLMAIHAKDDEYAISAALFERVMTFAAANYNIVSLNDVLKSRRKEAPLPSLPLLVTFDDGWDDNAVHAAPLLAAAGIPWTLFAATDAIASGERWWQEVLLAALRDGHASYRQMWDLAASESPANCDKGIDPILALLLLYGTLPPAKRDSLLARYLDTTSMRAAPRHMANWDTLRSLQSSGVGIGGHGASHLPLTMLADPAADLRQAHTTMCQQLGEDACSTMSFPHGRYNPVIADKVRSLGTQLLFTSDPILNKCSGGWLESDLVGRIGISTSAVANEHGILDMERIMPWLVLRLASEHSA